MTKQVQRRRGTSAQHTGFTGAEGEITVNTTNKSAVVHDGATAGGVEAARADLVNVDGADIASTVSGETVASLTVTSADINGGAIDNTTIGASTPSSGAFTTLTTTGGATIGGDLTVNGTTTTINSTTLTVDDINIVLASGAADAAAANGAGITIDGASATFNYASTGDKWTMNKPLDVTGTVTADGLTVDTNTLHVDSTNNRVGIGTVTPESNARLTVKHTDSNNLIAMGNSLEGLESGTNNGGAIYLGVNTSAADEPTGGIEASWGDATNPQIHFGLTRNGRNSRLSASFNEGLRLYTNDGASTNLRQRITNGGDISFYDSTGVTQGFYWDASTQRLGLGTTTPVSKIDIVHTGNTRMFLSEEATDTSTISAVNTANSAYSDLNVYANNLKLSTSGAERMRITSGGNVGIGTSSPVRTLSVDTTSQLSTRLRSTSTANHIEMADSNGSIRFGTQTSGAMTFFTGGDASYAGESEAMRIDSSGNVGIGTSSPNYKLDVQGGALGTTSGDTVDVLQLYSNVGNSSYLNFQKVRTSTGSNWNSAGTRIQQVIDATRQAYIQFNGDGNDYGISFGRDTTERLRIDGSGYLIAPQGITLGTAVGTYNADNTLDDYEEGTWTIGTNSDGTGVIDQEQGFYRKIGNVVHVWGQLLVSTNFSGTTINGLPFNVANNFTISIFGSVGIAAGGNLTTGDALIVLASENSDVLGFRLGSDAADGHNPNTLNDVYRFYISYMAA